MAAEALSFNYLLEDMGFKPENINLSRKQLEKLAPFLGLNLDNPEQYQARLVHVIRNFPFFYNKDGKQLIANFFNYLSDYHKYIIDAIEKPDNNGNNPYGNHPEIPAALSCIEHICNLLIEHEQLEPTPLNLKMFGEFPPAVYAKHRKIIERFLLKRPYLNYYLVDGDLKLDEK